MQDKSQGSRKNLVILKFSYIFNNSSLIFLGISTFSAILSLLTNTCTKYPSAWAILFFSLNKETFEANISAYETSLRNGTCNDANAITSYEDYLENFRDNIYNNLDYYMSKKISYEFRSYVNHSIGMEW